MLCSELLWKNNNYNMFNGWQNVNKYSYLNIEKHIGDKIIHVF